MNHDRHRQEGQDMQYYRAGIDIGSTTVKLVLLDEKGEIIFGKYARHRAHTREALGQLLQEALGQTGECRLKVKITGSGSINLGKALGIDFVQEVVAVASAPVSYTHLRAHET